MEYISPEFSIIETGNTQIGPSINDNGLPFVPMP